MELYDVSVADSFMDVYLHTHLKTSQKLVNYK